MTSQAKPPPRTTSTSRILGWMLARRRESMPVPLSQGDLGALIGVTQSAWSRVELGENALTVDGLLAVAAGLGVPASELLRDLEQHVVHLQGAGVRVVNERRGATATTPGAAFLAGAALTGIIVAALMDGSKAPRA